MISKKQRSIHQCQCATCQQRPRSATAKKHRAINRVLVGLDEKHRRRFVGLLVLQWPRGGVERLCEIIGLSRSTIRRGRDEIGRVERRFERARVR